MKKYLLFLTIFFTSCKEYQLTYEKPFIITGKLVNYTQVGIANFTFQDKKGVKEVFTDYNDKYNIGDTIK